MDEDEQKFDAIEQPAEEPQEQKTEIGTVRLQKLETEMETSYLAYAMSGIATTVVASVFALALAMAFVHVNPSLLIFTMTLQIHPDGLPAVAIASTNVTRVKFTCMYLLPEGWAPSPQTTVHPHGLPLYVESKE